MLGLGLPMPIERDIIPPWVLQGASIDLNFAKSLYYGASLSSALSVSRASTAYAQTSSGLLVPFAANVPCITDLGLQVWEGRTNVAIQSNNFALWSPGYVNGTTGSQNAVAPDGTANSAWTLTEGAGDSRLQQNITVANDSTSWTRTVYVQKTGSVSYTNINFSLSGGTGVSSTLRLNTQTGALAASSGTASVTASGTYWRVVLTAANNSSGNTTASFQIYANVDVNGNVQAGQSNVFAFSQQENASFPSPYIPTTTTSAARAADNITATGALLAVLQGSQASVIGVAGATPNYSINPRIIGSTPHTQGLPYVGPGSTTIGIYNGTTTLTATGGNVSTGITKNGVSWSAGARSVVGNGGTVATDSNSQNSDTAYQIGSVNGADYWDGPIQRLTVFNSRLPDATLKALTA